MFLETHMHSYLGSPCGKLSPEMSSYLYSSKGYGGIVITEHYNSNFFSEYYLKGNWEEKLNCFLSGYRIAKESSEKYNIKVFLGAEVTVKCPVPGKVMEFLIYGCTEQFFIDNPMLYNYTQQELYALCKKNNLVMVQAHPYRPYCVLGDINYMDGIEVFNGNKRHNNKNALAHNTAKKYNKLMLSGSDFHQKEDLAIGGIVVPEDISNERDLADYLLNNQPKLIVNGKVKK